MNDEKIESDTSLGFISWYLFFIWFFSGITLSIFGIVITTSIGIPAGADVVIGGTPGIFITWKALKYGTQKIIEENNKPMTEQLMLNIGFIISILILYTLTREYIIERYYGESLEILDVLFIILLSTFIIGKIMVIALLKYIKY